LTIRAASIKLRPTRWQGVIFADIHAMGQLVSTVMARASRVGQRGLS
jgi:hypothetical protein